MQSCISKSSSADTRGGCSRHEDDGFTIGAQRGALSQLQHYSFRGGRGVDQSSGRRSGVMLDEHQFDVSFGRSHGQRCLSGQDKEAGGVDSSTGSNDEGADVEPGIGDEDLRRAQSKFESEVASFLASLNSADGKLVNMSRLNQRLDEQNALVGSADRRTRTRDAYGTEETTGSQSRKSLRERQTGSGQQLLRRGVGSGFSTDVREPSGALLSPDQVRSGIRSDLAGVRQTYSPAFSVNSASNGRRVLPATPSTSAQTSARLNGLAERDNGRSTLCIQTTEAERHDETRRIGDHGVLASCGSFVQNRCRDGVDRRHRDDLGQFD